MVLPALLEAQLQPFQSLVGLEFCPQHKLAEASAVTFDGNELWGIENSTAFRVSLNF